MTHHFIILPTALLARRMRGLRSLIAGTCLGLLLLPAPAAEEPDAVSEAIKGAKSEAKGKAETIKAAADALKNARETAETNLIALDELIRFQRSHGGARNPAGSRDAISKALDRAQKEVDEYGTLYLSSPTLTRAGSNEFRFDLARGASNYFADAKTNVNGRAAAFEQTANTFMLNIRAQIDPANAAAYGAEVAEFERQFGDWRDRNAALRKAADLDLGADLAAAATNTSLSASNAAVAAADVGVAMGTGTDIAMESSGVTLVKGDLRGIVRAIRLGRAMMGNIRQNLFFAFFYNALGIPVAAGLLYPFFGLLLSPILAGVAMSLSSVSVVANALRLRRWRR